VTSVRAGVAVETTFVVEAALREAAVAAARANGTGCSAERCWREESSPAANPEEEEAEVVKTGSA
jgi:hypothetical protein